MLKAHLGASFFFSRNSAERRRPSNVLPTLVYQLAHSHPLLRQTACEAVTQDPDLSSKTVQVQFQKLVFEGLKNVQGPFGSQILIVLDALDECDKEDGREGGSFIPLLAHHFPALPFRVKVFMTSRPEASIRKLLQSSTSPTRPFVLHEIDAAVVEADVGRFLRSGFTRIADDHDYQPPWPTEEQIQELTTRADGLFIYAATAMRFVSSGYRPKRNLDVFLSAHAYTSEDAYATLDSVYMQILDQIPQDATGDMLAIFRYLIGSLAVLQQPLSRPVLGRLLHMDIDTINDILRPLYSLIDVDDIDRPIRIFHQSFSDFLTSRKRCMNENMHVDVAQAHLLLAVQCMKVMNKQLKQNICEIENSGLFNSELEALDDLRNRSISEELQYACVHWISHLMLTPSIADATELKRELDEFCTRHLLHWVEVLSLSQKLQSAAEGLLRVQEWCEVRTNYWQVVKALVADML
jgi:hypothetical protein